MSAQIRYVSGNWQEPIIDLGPDPDNEGQNRIVRLAGVESVATDNLTDDFDKPQADDAPAAGYGTETPAGTEPRDPSQPPPDQAAYDPVTGQQTAGTEQAFDNHPSVNPQPGTTHSSGPQGAPQ